MSYRRWTALLCSTVSLAGWVSSASAGDVTVGELARPNLAIEQSGSGTAAPAGDVAEKPSSQAATISSDATGSAGATTASAAVGVPNASATGLTTVNHDAAPAAPLVDITEPVPAVPAVEPLKAATVTAPPEPDQAAPAAKPQDVTASVPTQAPVASSAATSVPAIETPAATETPKSAVAAVEPTQPAAPAEPLKPTVAAAPPAAVAPPVLPAPVVTIAPAPQAVATAPETTAAPSPTPDSPVAPPVVVQDGVPADVLSASLKTEVDALATAKGADDRKASVAERKERAAVAAFYASRMFAPLWVDGRGLTAISAQAKDRLSRAGEDGLDPNDYQLPTLAAAPTPDMLAKAELQFTAAVVKYARQAQSGRFDPGRLSELVTEKPPVPMTEAILGTIVTATDVSQALEGFNPPHEGYKLLKAKLMEMTKGEPPVPQAKLPAGPSIRPGEKDVRVAVLRERLGVNGTATVDDAELYDPALVQAVKSFQKAKGLNPTGIVGKATVELVNESAGGPDAKAADIIANMERWRWLPRDLGSLHVMVNVPDFSLVIERDGTVTHKARVIVGKVSNQTPIFSETMTHIIVNPYWNVPESIVRKEFLGKAQETAGASLTRGNFEVEVGNHAVDPTAVDWSTVSAGNVHIRQRPGDGNALGNIKFMFPNQHSVYIHDTSSRSLFQQSYRSLSHGCVRVQEPFSFADALMAEEPTGITGAKLKSMIGGGEKYLWLKRPIPVHIAYFTAFVDEKGDLQTRPDLYGHNARVKQLLGL